MKLTTTKTTLSGLFALVLTTPALAQPANDATSRYVLEGRQDDEREFDVRMVVKEKGDDLVITRYVRYRKADGQLGKKQTWTTAEGACTDGGFTATYQIPLEEAARSGGVVERITDPMSGPPRRRGAQRFVSVQADYTLTGTEIVERLVNTSDQLGWTLADAKGSVFDPTPPPGEPHCSTCTCGGERGKKASGKKRASRTRAKPVLVRNRPLTSTTPGERVTAALVITNLFPELEDRFYANSPEVDDSEWKDICRSLDLVLQALEKKEGLSNGLKAILQRDFREFARVVVPELLEGGGPSVFAACAAGLDARPRFHHVLRELLAWTRGFRGRSHSSLPDLKTRVRTALIG